MTPPDTPPTAPLSAEDAMYARRSVRAFLPTPVERPVIEAILSAAARAPSGTNTQPWQVYVLTGSAKNRLSDAILAAASDPQEAKAHTEEYHYYPQEWKEPYLSRRRKIGWDLYGLLGIEKQDKARMQAQHLRNYRFFDAPVGLIFTIDRIMGQGSWLDYGMFLQNIMLAAASRGLATCPQAAFTPFHRIIAAQLGLDAQQQVVCGMSLGYEDRSKPENALVTEREPACGFTTFLS